MIEVWREAVLEAPEAYVAWGGLLIGLVFGFIVYRTNFCTMGSISDIVNFGDYRRFRTWLLAAAVAIAGAQLFQLLGAVDLSASMYLGANLTWLGNVLGGAIFGFGMVLAGGCVSRNLVRLGGGDLGSLVILIVVGIFAYMAIGGILGPIRAAIVPFGQVELQPLGAETQSMAAILSAITGGDSGTLSMVVAGALLAGILAYCFKDSDFRTSPLHIGAGVGIGLCVIAGWVLTGLAFDEFADTPMQPVSLTYVRPAGDTTEYLTRFTALGLPGFGVVTVFGAIAGAFLGALSMKRFRLTGFANVSDMLQNLGGAALMGIGGVMALGCTVGQALTGLSTLAAGSLITFVFIVAGGYGGVKYMEWKIMRQA
ncbi:MAG: YeeE/YedE family protein [Pseudomonadota bacterium]